jgi:iron only hydrogenase large subunit-like protein
MNAENPIYTEKTECQDCYRCVRSCPVKAIQVREGHASVVPDACIQCGRCTAVCSVGAKKVRDDLPIVRTMIASGKPVYASLAPSFRAEFPDIPEGQLIACFKRLGFTGISETALGAQEVSAACAELLAEGKKQVYISTACPAVVRLVERYFPQYIPNLTHLMSPVQAHCRILRDTYGEDIKVVLLSPCIAKKSETGDGLDAAITFADLRRWLNEEAIEVTDETVDFVPRRAEEGGWYPVEGGMNDGIRHHRELPDAKFITVSGVEATIAALTDLNQVRGTVFLEALACEGGCINGPQASRKGATVLKRTEVLDATPLSMETTARKHEHNIARAFRPAAIHSTTHTPAEIAHALLRIGKKRREDELNCGGCGYNSCRDFAAALLEDRAETSMCVSHLRKLAQNKATALITAMPNGVVIVDDQLRIVECNPRFVELVGGDASAVYEVNPDLEGAYLERLVPFTAPFRKVLNDGSDLLAQDITHQDRVIRLTVFTVEPHHTVGGVLQDITEPVIQREQIIQKAGEVMKKNLTTVQQIAFLLGENAADSEVLLNSIIESFSKKD